MCLGRHTVSGLVAAGGRAFADWSADYRLFERERIDPARLFGSVRRSALAELAPDRPVVALMDDTLLRKAGRKAFGTAWRRDPLGPKFQTNLVWAQRFLQVSLALPEEAGCAAGRARSIPVAWVHCPTPAKPKRKAPPEEWAQHRRAAEEARLPKRGAEQLHILRAGLDADGAAARLLVASVDGGYTNKAVLADLPPRTVLVGRIRKDAKLHAPPSASPEVCRGRRRQYGDVLPTPEQARQSADVPWQTVRAFAAGKFHDFKVKIIGPVRWRAAGPRDLQLMIVSPLAYRLNSGSRTLYREPAYLICTDPAMDPQQILQAFLWRWEIEVNHREEKTLLGTGQAQVRKPQAVAAVPAFQVAAYACLLLAIHRAHGRPGSAALPQPKWQPPDKTARLSTQKAIALLRAQTWGAAITNFSGFAPALPLQHEAAEIHSSLAQALFLNSS